jgi:hypothetical protein
MKNKVLVIRVEILESIYRQNNIFQNLFVSHFDIKIILVHVTTHTLPTKVLLKPTVFLKQWIQILQSNSNYFLRIHFVES